ncbi:MAG: exosortase system-associated protein, TIGR04073 family [Candidatus Omnitrophica bacterium]|nr:exosortase system-associated protein, TIGR04073 family [Candidatus Omnitrophota bacterium]
MKSANPGDKLLRGVENLFTGWLEIPDEINDASKETNPFTAFTYGVAQGTGEAVTRTGVGAHDTATFFIPDYDRPHMDEEHVF